MIHHPETFNENTVVILQGDINKIHENISNQAYLGSYEMYCTVRNKSWDIKIHFRARIFTNLDPQTKYTYPYDVLKLFEIDSVKLEGEIMSTHLTAYSLLEHHLSNKLHEIEEKFVYDSILMLETNN
ncbi:hypothetical protein QBX67_26960 [Bacillus sp. LS15-K4]|nr:hypothetical protein [Bacillus sp. LS15-K4]MDJ1478671.1 hypothetical protein [Bacillus sp. LS15-K4]